ncbi:MAG: hypothetical protein LBV18_06670 [Alistipes sp.]|jgi:hypothetical protein|nr:hypothetical protein [Alistipes sp.]
MSIEVWVAIIIPTVVFAVGVLINWCITKRNKHRELKLYKNLIESWTESASKNIDRQIKSLRQFGENVKHNDKMNFPRYEQYMIHFTRLNSLPIEKIAEVFMENIDDKGKKSPEMMYDYLSAIEYIMEMQKRISKYFDQYVLESEQIREEWHKNFKNFTEALYSRGRHPKWAQETDDNKRFYKEIGVRLSGMIQIPKDENNEIGMSVWGREFISPTLEYFRSPNASWESEIFLNISNQFKEPYLSYRHWENNRRSGDTFIEMSEDIKTMRDTLQTSLDYFKTHNLKRWYLIS